METIYSNCCMYSPDNILMCYISEKKANWYLKRNLANIIDNNAIKLKFQPDGLGKANDPYYTQKLANQCVVCGDKESLTKHHIIPYCFRRYFPDDYKNHMSHDVLPLCITCHGKYETLASSYKLKLVNSCETKEKKEFYNIWKKAKTLYMYSNQLPEEKRTKLLEEIQEYYSTENVENIIEEIAQINTLSLNIDWQEYAETIEDIEKFIVEWRKNFISVMQPQFMPEHWSVSSCIQLEQIKNVAKKNKNC